MPEGNKQDLKERIDKQKDGVIKIDEIKDFVFDDKDGADNLNELGDYLNSQKYFNNDIIKLVLSRYFFSKEWENESKIIGDKVKANQPLDNKELSLVYLQMVDLYSHTKQEINLKFEPNKPLSGELLTFIQKQYNDNKTYTPQTIQNFSQRIQSTERKDKNGLYVNQAPSNVEIPQIPELDDYDPQETATQENKSEKTNLNYVYNYCYRLMDWAKENFPNDINKICNNAKAEHYDQKKKDILEYARYDILLFAYEKYCEIINNNHEKIIKEAGYINYEEFQKQIELLEKFSEEASRKFPNISRILNIVQEFFEKIEENKKKYFANDEDFEKAENNSEELNEYIQEKSDEYKIDEIQKIFEKDPETGEEAEKYCEGINILLKFQNEINEKSENYGDSIEKYQKYIQGNIEIKNSFPLIDLNIDTQRQYFEFINGWSNKVDFNKYEKYSELREESGIGKDLHNMSILGKIIMDPQDEHFPILGVKNAIEEKEKKIDEWRNNLEKKNKRLYRSLNVLIGLWNGTIYQLASTGSSLAYTIASLLGKDSAKLNKAKNFYDNLFYGKQSSKQKEPIYDPKTHKINLNRHNGVSTVSCSIGQMLILIYGGGMIGGSLKELGIAANIAGKTGLFSMSFITNIGQSFVEAKNQNLNGGTALAYSMLSSITQSALELLSPNDVLLGGGSNIIQELIRNLVKDGSKNSFMLLGKIFLKNVCIEIGDEIAQETLQLAAGNLINMYADHKRGTDFGTDWSWQNFAQTAIITALTTGITTGTSYMVQMSNMNFKGNASLFNDVINNDSTYTAVMQMLDTALAGEIEIPGTDMASLQQLKTAFDSVNDIGSNLHEEWRNTRLKEDGTYDPRIKTTHDEAWIQEHNGQTEVDIANTTFENLPSDWQHENLEAAKVAESLVYEALAKGKNITQQMIEDMSSKVHEERLKRNTRAKGGELDVPYNQLPESEKAKDRNQVLLAIETTKKNLENSYFGGKSHKIFKGDTTKAESNSKLSDKILNEINEKNKSKKLKQLGKEITKQYEQATGIKIKLSEEQLLSILDAHEKDGELGKLSTPQLMQKVRTLSETISDANIIRFLFEAGFCGTEDSQLNKTKIEDQAYIGDKSIYKLDLQETQEIGNGAFWHCTNLTEISSFENLNTIGRYSFSDTGIREVAFSKDIKEIGASAFEDCSDLENVSFKDAINLHTIHERTFMNCSKLKKVDIPKNIIFIEQQAFANCTSLEEITIRNPLCKLGHDVFKGCTNLKTITIPETYKGKEEFLGIPSNCKVNYVQTNQKLNNLLYDKNGKIKEDVSRAIDKLAELGISENDIVNILEKSNKYDALIKFITIINEKIKTAGITMDGIYFIPNPERTQGLGNYHREEQNGGNTTITSLLNFCLMSNGEYLNLFQEMDIRQLICMSRTNIDRQYFNNSKYIEFLIKNMPIPDATTNIYHTLKSYKGESAQLLNTPNNPNSNEIQQFLSEHKLKEPMKVRRFAGYYSLGHLVFGDGTTLQEVMEHQEKNKDKIGNASTEFTGKSFINEYFSSTSVNPQPQVEGSVQWDITLEEGAEAYPLDLIGGTSEAEILINRNLKRTIEGIEINGNEVTIKAKVSNPHISNDHTTSQELAQNNQTEVLGQRKSERTIKGFKDLGIDLNPESYKKRHLDAYDFDFEIIGKFKELGIIRENMSDFSLFTFIKEYVVNLSDIKINFEKLTQLKEIGVNFRIQDIKEINSTHIDFNKLSKIKELGITLGSYNIQKFNNIERDFEKLQKIKELGITITPLNIEELNNLNLNFEKLQKIKEQGIMIDEYNIKELSNLDIDFEKLQKIKELGITITPLNIEKLNNLNLNFKKLKKLKEQGIMIDEYNIKELNNLDITDHEISLLTKYGIREYIDIHFFISNLRNADKGTIRKFINRKNEYLKNNRTLSLQKFKELFGGNGKYGKIDINQGGLGLCYAYTGFELLKKTNGFDELIQTNLREAENGREVRLPFCDKDGKWIKVSKQEIDKQFSITMENGENRTFSINSKSEYLGFKILEIAFIKKAIIDRYLSFENSNFRVPSESLEKAYQQFINTGDFELNGGLIIENVEGGNTIYMIQQILPTDYTIQRQAYSFEGLNEQMKYLAFEHFSKGLFKIDMSIYGLDSGEKLVGLNTIIIENEHVGKVAIVNDVNIINEGGIEIKSRFTLDGQGKLIDNAEGNLENKNTMNTDIVTTTNGKEAVMFFGEHAYSIEKCYINKTTGEKRVWIVNPRHTGIKFDISLEQAKEIFERNVIGINIDQMFQE